MKLLSITAIGRTSDQRSYYVIVKDPSTEKPLNEMMEKIGHGLLYYGEGNSPTEYKNYVENILVDKYDIDVIYTSDRIILVVRAPKEQQEIFKNLVLAYGKLKD